MKRLKALADNSQNILRLAAATSVLIAASGYAYRSIIYLPAKDAQERRNADTKELLAAQERAAAAAQTAALEKDRLRDAQASIERKQQKYDICVVSAQQAYTDRWNASCAKLADEAQKARAACSGANGTTATCAFGMPPVPVERTNCSLPRSLADSYDADLKGEKDRCVQAANIGDTRT